MNLSRCIPLVLLALTACPPGLPGPIAQLQRFEKAADAGQHAAVANETVSGDCLPGGSGSDACPAIFAVHGRSCLEVARAEAAPGAACPGPTPTAKTALDCAARDLSAAEASRKFDGTKLADIRQNRAQAQYCSATFLAAPDGAPLATQAEDAMRTANTAGGKVVAARAALYFAARSAFPAAQRCAGVQRARGATRDGQALQPDPATADALRRLASDADGWARSIPCGSGG